MDTGSNRASGARQGFLRRLARDTGGNTLAMMAIALIPISALAGSAVDTARMYVVRVRLQQACDAGALAGRRVLVDSDSTTLDANSIAQASAFFQNNFHTGWMQTHDVSFTPSKTDDKQVAATAKATVPMSVMKMFKMPDQEIDVSCQARLDVPDIDIVFVLDTTGSMACTPQRSDSDCSNYVSSQTVQTYTRPSDGSGVSGYGGTTGYRVPEESGSRISALRTAVTNFFSTMANNVDPSTHIRYGFVTYASMVNAGKAITDVSPSYMVGNNGVTNWTYQSRRVTADYVISSGSATNNTKSQAACTGTANDRNPSTPLTYNSSGQATQTAYSWSNSNNVCQQRVQTLGPTWSYGPVSYNVQGFVGGSPVTDPSEVTGVTTQWDGCVEERETNPGQSNFGDYLNAWPTSSTGLPPDLDPDLVPSGTSNAWRPYWPDVEYYKVVNSYNGDFAYHSYNMNDPALRGAGLSVCGKPIRRLGTMTASQVSSFVNATDFVPIGGTYHDLGMIWGTRLLSPKGIFAADTQPWPGRRQPKRVIIFLTDGDMAPTLQAYSMYGIEQYDDRVTNGDESNQESYHNARFLAECNRAKYGLQIDVWTISIAPAATTQLTQCASNSSQALWTTSGSGLNDKFQQIATAVANLRVSQ